MRTVRRAAAVLLIAGAITAAWMVWIWREWSLLDADSIDRSKGWRE